MNEEKTTNNETVIDPLLVYFSSVTENTKKFVEKLPFRNARLPLRRSDPILNISEPYLLFVPTYGGSMTSPSIIPKQVIKFLNDENNRKNCMGVIGSGNINFGESYLLAAKQVAKKLGVPLVYGVELAGTDHDVKAMIEGLEKTWSQLLEKSVTP